jgi:hypothetical protein
MVYTVAWHYCRQRAVSDVIWESNMHSLCSHCDRGYLSSKMDLSYASAGSFLEQLFPMKEEPVVDM